MTQAPSKEQIAILEAIVKSSNCVVIARPGSGKTFTLSLAIREIIPELPHYAGVIAISYTNKASDELEDRSLYGGMERKGSFFGTIDRFYLVEIIIPFGRHIFGDPKNEIDVVRIDEIDQTKEFETYVDLSDQGIIEDGLVDVLGELYKEGKIPLETIGSLANYVLENSSSCRRYLSARYSHVFIDEYQDCGSWQHLLFLKLIELGIQGVAVGDINQSIFAFAKKDSRYLIELTQKAEQFVTFPLTKNHRSHNSIINYSTRLLSSTYEPISTDDIRMFYKRVTGSEVDIGKWLNDAVPYFSERYQIDRNKVGVLFRLSRTGNLIQKNISFPHKSIVTTPLDNDSSLWGSVFRKILNWIFSVDLTKYELAETYLDMDLQQTSVKLVMTLLSRIERNTLNTHDEIRNNLDSFIEIARIIFPNRRNEFAIVNLGNVLSDELFIESFIPPNKNEVQLLTLHKAKGLEFDVVFHLDLYKWIMPMYKGDYIQDINLHYVGVTRASHCVILCTSTKRLSRRGISEAEDSEFVHINDLESLYLDAPI